MELKKFLSLMEESIDRKSVYEAAMTAARKIHDNPKKNIVKDMVDSAIDKSNTTAEAVEIVKQMMRSGYKKAL